MSDLETIINDKINDPFVVEAMKDPAVKARVEEIIKLARNPENQKYFTQVGIKALNDEKSGKQATRPKDALYKAFHELRKKDLN